MRVYFLSVPMILRFQRSNETGGGAQGVFRVVVCCVLFLSVDSVGPWALPVEEAQHSYLCNSFFCFFTQQQLPVKKS